MKKIDNLVKRFNFNFEDYNKIYYLLYEQPSEALWIKRLKLVSYELECRNDYNEIWYERGTFKFIDEWNAECRLYDTTHPYECFKYQGVLYEPETDDPEEELLILLVRKELIS